MGVSSRRTRRRSAPAAVIAAMSIALVLAPTAGAAGDPVATGKISLKVTNGFKKMLKRNGVRMGPRNYALKRTVSRVNPATGVGRVHLKGKLKFRGHGKRLVARKMVAKLGQESGNVKGRIGGRRVTLMRLRSKAGGVKVRRIAFGAEVTRISARIANPLVKRVNRKLDLDSLKTSRRLARVTLREQPKTVQVNSGFAFVDIPLGYLPPSPIPGSGTDPNTVAAKQPAHCIDPAGGVAAIPGDASNPARLTTLTANDPVLGPPPSGVAARFRLPVTGGTLAPAGNDGVLQLSGGVRLMSGVTPTGSVVFPQPDGAGEPGDCADTLPGAATSNSILDTTNLAPNLGELNVQANTVIGGLTPGCNGTGAACGPAVFPGDKGPAIGQVLDTSGIAVNADPTAKTIDIAGALIRNNQTATQVLNGLFPDASGATPFANGDKFGVSTLQVNTR